MSGWGHDLPETLVVLSHDREVLCSRLSRNLRRLPGLTGPEGRRLAASCGLSKQMMSRYMKGVTYPRDLVPLARLSLLTGLDMLELLYERPPQPTPVEDRIALVEALARPQTELGAAWADSLRSMLSASGMSVRSLRRMCGLPTGVFDKALAGRSMVASTTSLLVSAALGASPLEMMLGLSSGGSAAVDEASSVRDQRHPLPKAGIGPA